MERIIGDRSLGNGIKVGRVAIAVVVIDENAMVTNGWRRCIGGSG